jgi:hypothetical protein
MNELLKKSIAQVETEDTQAIAQRRGGASPSRPGGGIGGTGGRFRMIAYLDLQDE